MDYSSDAMKYLITARRLIDAFSIKWGDAKLSKLE